jgi:hypothetical protein
MGSMTRKLDGVNMDIKRAAAQGDSVWAQDT